MNATLVQRLADFAVAARDQGVPAEVATSVKQRVLDTLGICIAATQLDTSRAATAVAIERGGVGQAQAVGVPTALPADQAAFVNGVLAHSLDYDDTHLPSVLHPSATVVPVALAAGQANGASGRAVIAAAAVGLELCVRLGMAGYDREAGNSEFFERGQHATSICGTIAGAATAALLHGLDPDGVAHAMGIAASMAGGVIEANRTGGTVKRLHCGWAAHAAVSAAALAARGFTGPPTVLEGRFGFYQAFLGGRFFAEELTAGLGERWAVPGIFFKPYPANHFTHCAIDAAIALRERGLRPEDVAELRLGVATPTVRTIGEPLEVKRAPETGYQAQFSGPYTVVAALLGGGGLGLGLDDFTDELAQDPLRRKLMALVVVEPDPECDRVYPHQLPAVLRARTVDGRELVERVMVNRGGPDRPLTDAEIARKFADNAGRVLPAEAVEALRHDVERLEERASLAGLLDGTVVKEAHETPFVNHRLRRQRGCGRGLGCGWRRGWLRRRRRPW